MAPDRHNDKDSDKKSEPGIRRPGQQDDQQQDPNAPPQPESRRSNRSSQIVMPSTGNPDLDPVGLTNPGRIDLRETNPLVPQGMLYDPRQLLDQQRNTSQPGAGLPPGARFDPYGPPDPDLVGPGRGAQPDTTFGNPDPDHFQPPGMQPRQPRDLGLRQFARKTTTPFVIDLVDSDTDSEGPNENEPRTVQRSRGRGHPMTARKSVGTWRPRGGLGGPKDLGPPFL